MDGVPRAFPECSQSVPRVFLEPSRSSHSPSCPHKDGGVPPPISLTFCCNLGFSQRCNEMFVHMHVCPFVSSSSHPLAPPSITPPPPPHNLFTSLAHVRAAMLAVHIPPVNDPAQITDIKASGKCSGVEQAHVHVPTFPCCTHVCANTDTCLNMYERAVFKRDEISRGCFPQESGTSACTRALSTYFQIWRTRRFWDQDATCQTVSRAPPQCCRAHLEISRSINWP